MKLLSSMFAIMAVAITFFASCSDSDSSRSLTKEEIHSCYLSIAGAHTGELLFLKNSGETSSTTQKVDTLDITWTVTTDSTMTIHRFPVSALTENITVDEIKTAMELQMAQSLECKIGFVGTSPVTFLINPTTLTYNVTYGGAEHKLQFVFYVDNYYSWGSYTTASKAMQMQIVLASVYEDNVLKRDYLSAQGVVYVIQTKSSK